MLMQVQEKHPKAFRGGVRQNLQHRVRRYMNNARMAVISQLQRTGYSVRKQVKR